METSPMIDCIKRNCPKCCIDPDNPIPLTIGDLVRVSGITGMTLPETFEEIMVLEAEPNVINFRGKPLIVSWMPAPAFKRPSYIDPRPCIFLEDSLCSIHSHRPLSCRVFPVNKILGEAHSPRLAQTYPCLKEMDIPSEHDTSMFLHSVQALYAEVIPTRRLLDPVFKDQVFGAPEAKKNNMDCPEPVLTREEATKAFDTNLHQNVKLAISGIPEEDYPIYNLWNAITHYPCKDFLRLGISQSQPESSIQSEKGTHDNKKEVNHNG